MAQIAVDQATRVPRNFRTVIMAAASGNVIEWYDFYIFGSLATILSVKFFEKSHPVAALLSTIALFTAGFLVRPLGAFVFGWLGDRVGRKYTFIMTLVGMALGTGAIGLIPTFEQIGLSAAIILFCLRMLQGLCLGGSYGGAITYVAEHVADKHRGYYTGWLQTSPTLGIVLSLIVIIATRSYFGEAAFNAWAWRVPFLFSFLLIFVTLYMRANFEESPVYAEIKSKGLTSRNPWRDAFLNPANLKYVVIATIVVLGEGVVWYSSQFWALFYLQTVSKVDTLTSSFIVGLGLVIGTPSLVFCGWLSDIIGRKPVILGGFFLAAVTYYPLYAWLGSVTQPGNINMPIAILIVTILVCYVGMVYGPIGAFLAEFFPGRIRYTAVSMPYMIGNGWGGGLVPFITTAAFQATGSLAYALIYPIAVPAVCLILSLFLMPETRHMSIWEHEGQPAWPKCDVRAPNRPACFRSGLELRTFVIWLRRGGIHADANSCLCRAIVCGRSDSCLDALAFGSSC
jgi:MFS family permease